MKGGEGEEECRIFFWQGVVLQGLIESEVRWKKKIFIISQFYAARGCEIVILAAWKRRDDKSNFGDKKNVVKHDYIIRRLN